MPFEPKKNSHKPKLTCKSDEDFLASIQHLKPAHQLLLKERRELEKSLIDLIKDPVKPKTLRIEDAMAAMKKLKDLGKHVNRFDPTDGE